MKQRRSTNCKKRRKMITDLEIVSKDPYSVQLRNLQNLPRFPIHSELEINSVLAIQRNVFSYEHQEHAEQELAETYQETELLNINEIAQTLQIYKSWTRCRREHWGDPTQKDFPIKLFNPQYTTRACENKGGHPKPKTHLHIIPKLLDRAKTSGETLRNRMSLQLHFAAKSGKQQLKINKDTQSAPQQRTNRATTQTHTDRGREKVCEWRRGRVPDPPGAHNRAAKSLPPSPRGPGPVPARIVIFFNFNSTN